MLSPIEIAPPPEEIDKGDDPQDDRYDAEGVEPRCDCEGQ